MSSIETFYERCGKELQYQLQYDPLRSGRLFRVFCEGIFPVDLWIIDQDDVPESLFFWTNFDANKQVEMLGNQDSMNS
ncbi:hypothetical protein BT69DRAFT_1279266 [Atractiella rhizophila]|nr:hypothetical protein BT69DRAFT_1279266 [Atractiella rhizophila]